MDEPHAWMRGSGDGEHAAIEARTRRDLLKIHKDRFRRRSAIVI